MSKRKYPSGAQKRQEQNRKEQYISKLPKISSFLSPNQPKSPAATETEKDASSGVGATVTDAPFASTSTSETDLDVTDASVSGGRWAEN